MCGIAGTIYSREYLDGILVNVDDLFVLVDKIQTDSAPCSMLLDMAWKYKSNVNFIRYCKTASER